MDARKIRKLQRMLNRYLSEFDDCFSRSEPAQNLRVYVNGQLSDLQRKSIEPMADHANVPPRTLQQFLSLADWDDHRMTDRIEQIVARDHSHALSIGIIDETGHPKKGKKTAGVQRQWCGARGKVDNCVVTVHVSYVAGEFHTLLPGKLFLPEAWSHDRARCREAKIPWPCAAARWPTACVSSGSPPTRATARCRRSCLRWTTADSDTSWRCPARSTAG